MPRLDLDSLLASCGPAVRKLNPGLFSPHSLPSLPQPKPAVLDGIPEAPLCKARFSTRVLVRITSYRCQPADPDNIIGKWMVDCLRYSRVIRNDRKEDIDYQVHQEKVRTKKEERTEILVIPLD